MKFSARGVVVASALAVSSGAVAQNAAQWRVEDGGNGHWYRVSVVEPPSDFDSKLALANGQGGSLASISDQAENDFIFNSALASGLSQGRVCIGGRRCGGCDWRWTDGTEWSYSNWGPGEPGNPGDVHAEMFISTGSPRLWADVWDWDSSVSSFVIEWSADCNNDGIVDYGQIRAGELADTNANNIPDCCEQGFDCRFQAVQWRVKDGGNGHWYEGVLTGANTWSSARTSAIARGGALASLESVSERAWVFDTFSHARSPRLYVNQHATSGPVFGPWIGAYQDPMGAEPDGGWRWLTGSRFDPHESACCNDDSGCALDEDRLHLYWYAEIGQMSWNDLPDEHCGQRPIASIVEYSADCNNDGIVDYGQIRAGELADTNANNIPDCCEGGQSCDPCAGDVDNSGSVNGVDLAAVLGNWGTNGGKYPGADTNHDGIVDGIDLAQVLGGWGPCP
jgi:ferredoxin